MRFLHAALAAALVSSCRVVDARAWNLNELHDENGRHRYSGAIEGDMEFFFRHVVARSLAGSWATVDDKGKVAIPDPAGTCLENLVLLDGYRTEDPRNFGIQVEWYSRLAVADPARLSREHCLLALGRAGAQVQAGNPAPPPKEPAPAGPDASSEALAGLLRAATPLIQKGSDATATERLDLDSACQVVTDLSLDLDGARRLLHAAIDMAAAVGFQKKEGLPLAKLCEELERRCIRYAIAAGLRDPDPLPRGAAVEAAVLCVGPAVLDPILAQLGGEPSADVLVRVLGLVRDHGLPSEPPAGSNATPEQARRARLSAILALLDRPESPVRVAAMLALARVADSDVHSLREEDWQAWWAAQSGKPGT